MMGPSTASKKNERVRTLRRRSIHFLPIAFLAITLNLSACQSLPLPGSQVVLTPSFPLIDTATQTTIETMPDNTQSIATSGHLSPTADQTSSPAWLPPGTPPPPADTHGAYLPSLPPEALTPTSTATLPEEVVRFAVIGDYGGGGIPEADVAAMVLSWQPDLILTTGDNNYPSGSAETIDFNVGQFYHAYIFPYSGRFGPGAQENRFFPTLGNHDWNTDLAQPYLDYFALPGNERYYDFVWGSVHFFALDSDPREPDGVDSSSKQAAWLKERLIASETSWQIVYFHAPPYSSGLHGSVEWMRWPFAEWGADAVLAGHDHIYERISRDGIVYFVNGLGGGSRYPFSSPVEGSQLRYNLDYGAQLVEASSAYLRFQFFNRLGEVVDDFMISQP